jgi:hypothetical protein
MVKYPVDLLLGYLYLYQKLFTTSKRVPQMPFFENDIYASVAE